MIDIDKIRDDVAKAKEQVYSKPLPRLDLGGVKGEDVPYKAASEAMKCLERGDILPVLGTLSDLAVQLWLPLLGPGDGLGIVNTSEDIYPLQAGLLLTVPYAAVSVDPSKPVEVFRGLPGSAPNTSDDVVALFPVYGAARAVLLLIEIVLDDLGGDATDLIKGIVAMLLNTYLAAKTFGNACVEVSEQPSPFSAGPLRPKITVEQIDEWLRNPRVVDDELALKQPLTLWIEEHTRHLLEGDLDAMYPLIALEAKLWSTVLWCCNPIIKPGFFGVLDTTDETLMSFQRAAITFLLRFIRTGLTSHPVETIYSTLLNLVWDRLSVLTATAQYLTQNFGAEVGLFFRQLGLLDEGEKDDHAKKVAVSDPEPPTMQ